MADISRLLSLVSGVVTGVDLTSNNFLFDQISLKDTGADHYLTLDLNENLTATRTLSILVGDANRSLTISGDSTINQDVSTTGAPTFAGVTLTGDITTTGGARDWDLVDNDASALSFDSAGKAGILEIDTTDAAEGVKMSGYLTVTGDLIVNGTTTTINTQNLLVEDKLVTLNNGGAASSGGGSGIEVEEDSAITGYVKVSSDRNSWEFKSPNNAAVVTLTTSATETITVSGSLNIEADSFINQDLTTDAAPTFAGVTLTGDITTTGGAIDWDLADNNASALSFDSAGKAGILNIITTDTAEGVSFSGTIAMATGATIDEFSTDETLAGDSDTALPTEKAVKAYVDGAVSAASPDFLEKEVTIGETIGVAAETHIYPVRYAVDGETAGRVYLADKDAVGNCYAIGFISITGEQIAGATATLRFSGSVPLGADDTAFNATSIGLPVYTTGSGTFGITAPSTAGEAVYRLGVVATTTSVEILSQLNGVN